MDADDRQRLLAYDDWANREVLTALRAVADPPAKAVNLFAHLVAARTLWLDRLRGRSVSVAVWAEWSLDEAGARLDGLRDGWLAYSESISEEGLATPVSYVDQRGSAWATRPRDIFVHVALHGPYHRGQIAALLGVTGHTPPMTDYIVAVRRDLIP